MKTIKCDRCSKEIPYVPPYMNVAKQGVVYPKIIMSIWDPLTQSAREVDLCNECERNVYNYIFDYEKGNMA